MEIEELRKIVELMEEHGLTYFDMSKDDFRLKLKKGEDLESLERLMRILPTAAPAPALAAPATLSVADDTTPALPGEPILSPMVGTFYRRPAPDAANFVEVGDSVSVGQTLCIIEAMKVMNEIKSEVTGTVTAVVVEDGQPVQYGDVLFQVQ